MKKVWILVLCICLFCSCGKADEGRDNKTNISLSSDAQVTDDQVTTDLTAYVETLYENALPATSDPSEWLNSVPAPGTLTPVCYLKQAPQNDVGKPITISMKNLKNDLIFAYYLDDDTETLVFLYSAGGLTDSKPILFIFRTQYGSQTVLMENKSEWCGKLESVKIIDVLDYQHIANGAAAFLTEVETGTKNTWFGRITEDGKVTIGLSDGTGASMLPLFNALYERFEININSSDF